METETPDNVSAKTHPERRVYIPTVVFVACLAVTFL